MTTAVAVTTMQWSAFVSLTLNIPHHTMPHKLCRSEVKGVHVLQGFAQTRSGGNGSVLLNIYKPYGCLATFFKK